MPKRIKDFTTEATSFAADDFLGLDGATNGSRKIKPSALTGGWVVKTSAYTASTGDRLLADTSAGAFTITLPASPAAGAYVEINDAEDTWATNNLTVARNGAKIDSLTEDLVCNLTAKIGLTYIDATIGWRVDFISEIGGAGGALLADSDSNIIAGLVFS